MSLHAVAVFSACAYAYPGNVEPVFDDIHNKVSGYGLSAFLVGLSEIIIFFDGREIFHKLALKKTKDRFSGPIKRLRLIILLFP